MCGIAGILTPGEKTPHLQTAIELLAHRGPDDSGVYEGVGVGLAARRLSIIDVAGGHQPLSNEDGTIWISYNGEVYNAPALRAELATKGHQFRTHSDTETIVHAYETWGDEVVCRLRGMFVFAIWDGRKKRLLLARDRFGIKPLYYTQENGRFAFASEIAPLFALLPTLPRHANPEALWRLFEMGFIPTPLTAFVGIHKLPAAHLLVVAQGSVEIRPYWQLTYPSSLSPSTQTEADSVRQFMDKLQECVTAWRMSDVPVGSLLSGGIDSASLAALLTQISGNPIHTFHIAFAATSHDESAQAQLTANSIGSQHHVLHFSETDFACLPQVVRHLEEPQCSATSIPLYKLYQACHAAGFKVILTGEGADELLGGYHWFDGDRRIRPFLTWPSLLRQQIAKLPLPVSAAGRRVLAQGTPHPITRYALWQQVLSSAAIAHLLPTTPPPAAISQQWATYERPLNGRSPLHQFLFLEAHTRMVDFINFEVDRMSMANSVEARPPFLDHELWEFCAQLPPDLKLRPGVNKFLLRQGMKGILPTAVWQRPKQGLATPHAAWWRHSTLPAWAEEALHPAALRETRYFDPGIVQQMRQEQQNGRFDHSRALMGILTTQLWHQEMKIEQ